MVLAIFYVIDQWLLEWLHTYFNTAKQLKRPTLPLLLSSNDDTSFGAEHKTEVCGLRIRIRSNLKMCEGSAACRLIFSKVRNKRALKASVYRVAQIKRRHFTFLLVTDEGIYQIL